MLTKCIAMVVGFTLTIAALTYTSETKISTQPSQESTNRSVDETSRVAGSSVEERKSNLRAAGPGTVLQRIEHVTSEMALKIKHTRDPMTRSTLTDAKTVLERTVASLRQGEISSVEAQNIAAITFSGIARQAKQRQELTSAQTKAQQKLREKMKGHEETFLNAAIKGAKSAKQRYQK